MARHEARFSALEATMQEMVGLLRSIDRSLLCATPKSAYSVEEAAHVIGLSAYTVRQACNTGRIKAQKKQNKWRLSQEVVEDIQKNGMPKATVPTYS